MRSTVADIIAWPYPAQSNHNKRIATDLAQALTAGTDLGPRGPHMQALSSSVIANIATLRDVLPKLKSTMIDMGLGTDFIKVLHEAIDLAENAALMARSYSDTLNNDIDYESSFGMSSAGDVFFV